MQNKEYIRPMPALWWLHNRHVTLFMIRELSSLFVAGYSIFLIVMLYRFGQGDAAFHAFFQALGSPASIVIQLIVLVFVVFHTVTTVEASPVLMVVWRGEEKLNPAAIVGANYAAWLVASILILLAAAVLR
jgi:fumarate reductase subunit C